MADRRLVELARELVRIPSVTTDGTRRAAELLRDEVLCGSDLDVRLEPGPERNQVNLIAAKGLGSEPPLLLNSHLDTVPPGDPSLWTECDGDPFGAAVRDGFLYGLGSADAKLDGLCKGLALASLEGRRFRRGVLLAGTWGEERGLLGARELLHRLPERPVAAWAGEPTELALVTRHKGLLVVSIEAAASAPATGAPSPTTRIRVEGRSAHSSTPHLGDNAIFRALDRVSEQDLALVALSGGDAANKVPALCELEVAGGVAAVALGPGFEVVGHGRAVPMHDALREFLLEAVREIRHLGSSGPIRDDAFDPPFRTASLGCARAAADRVSVTADFRPLPGEGTQAVREALERFVSRFRRDGIRVGLVVERDNPPLESAARSAPVLWSLRVLSALGRPTALQTKAGCTEAGFYGSAGIPSVVFGPGRSGGNVHRPNERVPLADLEGAVAFYRRLLEEVCVA